MTRRIFRSISTVAISIIVVVTLIMCGIMYTNFSNVQMERLEEETQLVCTGVSLMGQDYLDSIRTDTNRITWIAADGTVIYDSHSDTSVMENHLSREEILQAFGSGSGSSRRYSDTLTEEYLYYAQRLEDGTVVRLSVAQKSVVSLLLTISVPVVCMLTLAVAVSVALARNLSKSIITPLNNLNLDRPMDNSSYEELSPLLHRIDSRQKEIMLQSYELQKKADELDTITENMKEAIVLLKNGGYVVSINASAKNILGIESRGIGKKFRKLCDNSFITDAMELSLQGQRSEITTELKGGFYQLSANPVISEGQVKGAVLLFLDVTEKEQAEQLRRQFTANVSHELKTPLHTIRGYSELIMSGIATGDDVGHFAGKINSEARRMSRLIQDIISLSQLDEGNVEMEKIQTDLLAAAQAVASALADTADNAQVTVSVTGQPLQIVTIPHLLHSIIYNLTDNAIKYNHQGGSVMLNVYHNGRQAVITVEDTGIGIPAGHQERVFQRFYRVDKSRSKEKGGSGLGLSIVKHAARLLSAGIELESVPDKGTRITVTFPCDN